MCALFIRFAIISAQHGACNDRKAFLVIFKLQSTLFPNPQALQSLFRHVNVNLKLPYRRISILLAFLKGWYSCARVGVRKQGCEASFLQINCGGYIWRVYHAAFTPC